MICAWLRRALLLTAVLSTGVAGAEPLTLAEALRLAAQHDPAFAESTAVYEAEAELGTQERALLKPAVTADARGGFTDRSIESEFFGGFEENYASYGAGVELRQPLFRLDWFARRERARANDELAQANLDERRQQLLKRVAERYFGVLVAQDALAQAEAEARAVRESLEDTRKRYDVELVPGTDLKEAQARDDVSQARLVAARGALENARETLAETSGRPDAELPLLAPGVQFPPLTPADPESWLQAARVSSPRLRIAREQLALARTQVRSRQAEAAPTLDIVALYRRDDSSDSQIGQLQDQRAAMLELTVPLYAGGINGARVREVEARLRAAEAADRRAQLESEREVRQLLRQVLTAYAEVAALERALISGEAAEQATRYGYDAGTRTITDVLDARSRTVQARQQVNQTRYRLLLALMQLKITSGTLATADFARVDELLLSPPLPVK